MKTKWLLAAATTLVLAPAAWAQTGQAEHSQHQSDSAAPAAQPMEPSSPEHQGMEHSGERTPSPPQSNDSMPGMDHSGHGGNASSDQGQGMSDMEHGGHEAPQASPAQGQSRTAQGGGGDMDNGDMKMQGGSPPPDARDPYAYSNGYDFGPNRMRMADEHNFGFFLADRFEAVNNADDTTAAYDLQGWYGRLYNRAVVKAEGAIADGEFNETSTELLWGHAIATFWDSQLGMRIDSSDDKYRSWLALGIQGLAPYWFELGATVYVSEEGRPALNLEAEYELLLTQRLILQPSLEADFYGKEDAELGQSSGLSDLTAGLRLRYEIRREFAPYVGLEWAGTFGGTADFARAAGLDTEETRAVAGLRFWY